MTIEWWIAGALLMVTLVPMGWKFRSRYAWGAVLVLASGTAAGMYTWHQRLAREELSTNSLHNKTPREDRAGGYVRSDTCRSCHPAEYASWRQTFHRTMTQHA